MKFIFIPLVVILLWIVNPGSALAYDIYMQIHGIPGDSLVEKRVGWINVMSYAHGIAKEYPMTGEPTRTARVKHGEISILKRIDLSSIPVTLAVGQGTSIPKIIIEITRMERDVAVVVYRLTLTGARITSMNTSAAAGGDGLIESLTLAYDKILWEYFPSRPGGGTAESQKTEWDILADSGK